MMPGESIRYACGHCHIVFDICMGAEDEGSEILTLDEKAVPMDVEPTVCPFCGAGELRAKHEAAIHRPVRRREYEETFLN